MENPQWMTDFENWLRENDRAEKTIAAYEQDERHFLRWHAGAHPGQVFEPGVLTEELVKAYFMSQEEAAAPKSKNRRLAALRMLARWAMSAGALKFDPTLRQRRFSEESLPPRAKQVDEMCAIQGVISAGKHLAHHTAKYGILGLRDQVIFSLAADAGLRESEIAGLKLTGVDLEKRYLTVLGKGRHVGHVKINTKLVALLQHWFTVHPGGEFVVCDWQGNGLSRSQVWRRIVAIGKAADVDVKPHDLRHGFCLNVMGKALKDGLSPENALDVVRRQARHRDVRTTQMYLRATDGDLERVMEAL